MINDDKPTGNIVIYESQDGLIRLNVQLDEDTVWLTQKQIASLFNVGIPAISKHLNNIYEEGELSSNETISKMEIVQQEGERNVNRTVTVYNLDAIISVGYRVNSKQATHFRQWATSVLKEYIVKGFSLDDARLKEGGSSYWKELLDRIRDIRSSEKMLYRQVLDLYATAVDYNPNAPESLQFFKIVQNKLHYGAHGHTASEVIFDRADANKPFMGLTTFSGNQVVKRDIGIAKNYLEEDELKRLNALVSGYFDIAEFRAQQHIPSTMSDYIKQLDNVLMAADAPILKGAGKRSHKQAIAKAEREYKEYQKKTLSPIEEEYFKQLESTAKAISKHKNE